MKPKTFDRLVDLLFAGHLLQFDDRSRVMMDSKFIEDLGFDSLDIVEMTMAVEEDWGIDIPDEDAERLLTVGDVVRYINDNAEEADPV